MNIIIKVLPSILALVGLILEISSRNKSSHIIRNYDSLNSILVEKFKNFINALTHHCSSEILQLNIDLSSNFKPFDYDYMDFYKICEKIIEKKYCLNRALFRIKMFRIIFILTFSVFLVLLIIYYLTKLNIPEFLNIINIIIISILLIYYLIDSVIINNKIDDIEREYGYSK